jgi:hypothetical protein
MLSALATVGKLVVTGGCLALGFWGMRKFTDRIDVWFAKRDQKLMKECERDLAGAFTQEK